MTILDRILRSKKEEVRRLGRRAPLALLKKKVLGLPPKKAGFLRALERSKTFPVIAEVKRKSPSGGVLSRNFDPAKIARAYEKAGAAALSVLTDRKFFGGSLKDLSRVRARTRLPILRKDFIVDEYQVWESRLAGADAVLLIAAALPAGKLGALARRAAALGLDVLFEVHSAGDLRKIGPLRPGLVGINNRDLRTFRADLGVTRELLRHLPKGVLAVSESGIQTPDDLIYLKNLGARAALVGESFMKEKNPGAVLGRWNRALRSAG
ncbi:MAG: indole-3-glycerol phosphate synthase TrpC [Candidatus Omnitrophica bacterium]|nr:indole-3-glycerol phosphate synthase TrpC [Candidatus Omnitrophota bacterium]